MTYFIRRILSSVPVLIGVTTITFFLLHMVPGDPIDIMLGEQASALDKQALRLELGLDRPIATQYAAFIGGVGHFDLGRSLHSKRPVTEEILERMPATFELAAAAMILAIFTGIPLGVISAVCRRHWWDRVLRFWGLLGLSTPAFWLGPMFILVFAIYFDLFPVSERGGIDNLILPASTLAFSLGAILMQTTRASVIEVINEDFINVVRAKGAAPARLYFKHALSNALIPIITIIGLQSGALLTGTVIIETIFDWPGIGSLLFQAIQQRNYPVVQGCVLVIACIYVAVNLLTDLAYAMANPKVRLS